MILLDAYALVALMAEEPATEKVRELLSEEGAAITTANLAEAAYILERKHDFAVERFRTRLAAVPAKVLRVVPLDERQTWRAAQLRVAHYHRTKCPLSLADCVLLASVGPDDRLATADPHVLAAADREGLATVPLPGRG